MDDHPQPVAHPVRHRISGRRRAAYLLIIIVLLLLALEGTVRLGLLLRRSDLTLQGIFSQEREIAALAAPGETGARHEVVHPFVGYVVDPSTEAGVNQYGFLQVDGPIVKRRAGLVIVGVTGGSVARELCEQSAPELKRRLRELIGPLEVAVVCLAQKGFRQPQQVMTCSYFQCLGAEFDFVVNLDGFNEGALYPKENMSDDAWYVYPRAWEFRLVDSNQPELTRLIAEAATLQRDRSDRARRFSKLQWLPLMSVHLVWRVLDGLSRDKTYSTVIRARELTGASQRQYSHVGPVQVFSSKADRTAALVDLWSQCSITLNRLCSASGARYLHRLQPNIGIDTVKVKTAEEQRLAWDDAPYREASRAAYPALIARGAELKASGIDFEDLTRVYAGVAKSVYRDDCCHMNQLGYDLLARALAESIGQQVLSDRESTGTAR